MPNSLPASDRKNHIVVNSIDSQTLGPPKCSSHYCYVALANYLILNLSKAQFPHLQNEADNSIHFTELLYTFNLMCLVEMVIDLVVTLTIKILLIIIF